MDQVSNEIIYLKNYFLIITLIHYHYHINIFCRSIKNRLKEAKNMRKNTQDLFRKQYGYSWDYVMVFKVHQEDVVLDDYQMIYSIRNILYSLAQGGLEIRLFYSVKVSYILFKDIMNENLYVDIRNSFLLPSSSSLS